MSTKIYNGRIISAPLFDAYKKLQILKKKVKEKGHELQTSWIVRHATTQTDYNIMHGRDPVKIYDAWREMLDRNKRVKAERTRDPEIDFEFELWLFPQEHQTLFIPNTEKKEFMEMLDSQRYVKDYSYWDNTDPDEKISKEEWEKRKKDWDRVLPVGSSPSDRCLVITMFNHEFPEIPFKQNVFKYIPDIEHRVKSLAERIHIHENYSKLIEEKKALDPEYKLEGFGLYFNAVKMCKSEDSRYKEIYKNVSEKISEYDLIELLY